MVAAFVWGDGAKVVTVSLSWQECEGRTEGRNGRLQGLRKPECDCQGRKERGESLDVDGGLVEEGGRQKDDELFSWSGRKWLLRRSAGGGRPLWAPPEND